MVHKAFYIAINVFEVGQRETQSKETVLLFSEIDRRELKLE